MTRSGALLASLILAACGGARPTPDRGPAAQAWSYTFRLDPNLTRLEADVCFEGPMPAELVPIHRRGRRYLRAAEGPLGEAPAPLPRGRASVALGHLPPDSCVRYVVDLEAAARDRGGIAGAYRIGDDLVASTEVWLWAPRPRDPGARVTATFELPPDVTMSPLWARRGEVRFLDSRAFELTAYAAFGRFEVRHAGVPGACLHISILGPPIEMGSDALVACLVGSAEAASMMLGRFGAREAGVLAVPTPLSSSSPFGIVGRGTMPTVALLVGDRATPERLCRAWVPVHEFSHLSIPYIDRDDAWLSEGIATYYQEVLRARAGLISREEAWQNLDDGFARGRADGTGRPLRDESRAMSRTAAYRRVYWAGAAIALMADVEIRVRSGGQASLDDALRALHACCGEARQAMRGEEAVARLSTVEDGVFGHIARRWLGRSEFPDLTETYRRLGLARGPSGALEPVGGVEEALLRDAILDPPTQLADRPPCGPWFELE